MAGIISTIMQNHIVNVLARSTLPLSSEEIQDKLRDNEIVYSLRHINRKLKELEDLQIVECVGKDGKAKLYSMPGQQLEPWHSTSPPNTKTPNIRFNGFNYTPDQLTRELMRANWSILSSSANSELVAEMTLLTMGSAAHDVLKAHSILPVAHLRRPLESFNAKLKILSQMIETILSNELIKTGASGQSISDNTRDQVVENLEGWIQELSTNIRSNVQ